MLEVIKTKTMKPQDESIILSSEKVRAFEKGVLKELKIQSSVFLKKELKKYKDVKVVYD